MRHEFRNLKIWQRAIDLTIKIYEVTNEFPKEELYTLTSQIRRSAISVSSNIAEGSGYESKAQFLRFLNIAIGSICELESQLQVAENMNFLMQKDVQDISYATDELKRMIIGFKNKLK